MNRFAVVAGIVLAGGVLWYALGSGPDTAQDMNAATAREPEIGQWGFELSNMDTGVAPGNDFYRYAVGTWFDNAVIPADRASTGSFLDLSILSEDRVQAILAALDNKTELSDVERKVRDLYRSYLDIAKLEEGGLAPAEADLAAIANLQTHEDVAAAMASVRMESMSLFRTGIGIDDKNPNAYAVFVMQSGLGLPDRDYYLLDETGVTEAREAYRDYVAQMLTLGGAPEAEAAAKAATIFALETRIAQIHWPREDRRDADKIYNPMMLSALSVFAPGFPWNVYFSEMQIGAPPGGGERIVVASENTAFPPLARLFAETPVPVWRDYLTFHYLDSHAPYLPKRFDDARFAFRGAVLAGQDQQLDRPKRGVQFLNRMIGEGVGQIYVARHFPAEAKAEAEQLVANLLEVYRERILTVDWMSEETRAKALEKVMNFTVKIGYPDDWRDYSRFDVVEGDLLGNAARGAEFDWTRDVVRLDDPVDRSEWYMSPQTVNAYYNPSLNEIVFPAAILQPPFFDFNADDAVNYGGIGAVIGHEISHGFDDQGSKYDATGVLDNWWTQTDRANFDARTAQLVDQFDAYSPIEGMTVNGQLTLGENIADLAGITIAHAAYRLSLGGEEPPVLDGLTGDQRLFLGYAQVWRYKAREADMRRRILSDPHSPPEYRIVGVLRNVDAWYDAFGVTQGDALYLPPQERVSLW